MIGIVTAKQLCCASIEIERLMLNGNSDAVRRKIRELVISAMVSRKSSEKGWIPS